MNVIILVQCSHGVHLSDFEINFNPYGVEIDVTLITYADFAKLDMRVAKVISVEEIPGKSKIIKGTIDLGNEKRDVIIGGAQYYKPEELLGRTVIALVNLEPRKIAGIESGAMLLAADSDDKPFWLTVTEDVPLGTGIK